MAACVLIPQFASQKKQPTSLGYKGFRCTLAMRSTQAQIHRMCSHYTRCTGGQALVELGEHCSGRYLCT